MTGSEWKILTEHVLKLAEETAEGDDKVAEMAMYYLLGMFDVDYEWANHLVGLMNIPSKKVNCACKTVRVLLK